jgi:hypothetical protein
MAVAFTHLTAGTSAAADPTTASIAPTANRLILVTVYVFNDSNPVAPTSVVGNGITYVLEETTGVFGGSASNDYQGWTYRGMSASPSSGVITITHANGQGFISWTVSQSDDQVDTGGTNGSAAVVQSVPGTVTLATGLTINLAAFGSANNGTYGVIGLFSTAFTTPGTGFTELSDLGNGEPQSQYRIDNDTSVDWTFASNDAGGIAFEIKAAAGGGGGNVLMGQCCT